MGGDGNGGTTGSENLRRLVEFNALLAEANRIAAYASGEATMLEAVCELAVGRGNLQLVWVGVPSQDGRVDVVASAGRTDYLSGLHVAVDPDAPEGLGPFGRAWREGSLQYVASIEQDPGTGPWREAASRLDLTGIVSIPLQRNGTPWGIITFYLAYGTEFGPDIRLLLDEVARTLSRGLDRLDADAREQELLEAQRLLLDHTFAGISMGRDRVLVLANRHLARMLGYNGPQDMLGKSTRILYASDIEYERVGRAYTGLRRHDVERVHNVRLARQDGAELIGDVTLSMVHNRGVETVVWTVQDVTERFHLEQTLADQAYHDALTGLPNRRALDLEIPRAIERARRNGTALVVGMMDLDEFKTINDTLGHHAGDGVLRTFARLLRKKMRGSDFLARPGGDEFVLLLQGLTLPLDVAELSRVFDRLFEAVEAPVHLSGGHARSLRMSLGLSVFPSDGLSGEELQRKADQSL